MKKSFLNRVQFLARFSYDGHRFYGVQEQPGLPTVLGALRARIKKSSSLAPIALSCTARTDRYVSAFENYATFYLKNAQNINDIINKACTHRDDGLYNLKLFVVSPYTHARGNSRNKTYRYMICYGRENIKAISNPFAWHIAPHLHINAMNEGAKHLIGTHDFSSFKGGGKSFSSPVKTIHSIAVRKLENKSLMITINGTAFLRKMVRNIVGLLVEIGSGLKKPDDALTILHERSRKRAGIMAPALGLMLISIDFNWQNACVWHQH